MRNKARTLCPVYIGGYLGIIASILSLAISGQAWEKNYSLERSDIAKDYSTFVTQFAIYDRPMEGTPRFDGFTGTKQPGRKLGLFEKVPAGWNGVRNNSRFRRFDYKTTDGRDGIAITYSPEPWRVAAWIFNAIDEVDRNRSLKLSKERRWQVATELAKYIAGQSHSQFPVVGTVWEDIAPTNGASESYRFLDGITISYSSLPEEGYFQPGQRHLESPLKNAQLEHTLKSNWDKKPDIQAAKFGRIASTERVQINRLYTLMGKATPPLCGNNYPDYVRKTHITAMRRGKLGLRNEMFVASILYHLEKGHLYSNKYKRWNPREEKISCQ